MSSAVNFDANKTHPTLLAENFSERCVQGVQENTVITVKST
jgi:hypothetical protein